MGTSKRLKDAEDRLKNAEDAVPGAYESRYTGQVGDQLSQMGAQNAAGFDYDTTNEAYQQYRARVAQNAQDAATAATNTAQSLAGGYGADWAASAANQAAAGQTAAAGTSLSDLRSQALQQWQNELSNENNLVDTLLGQDAQERSTAGMNTGAAQNWRDYLSSRAGQARQENSDFWSNVWNSVLNVGNAIKNGYDSYQGYTQQRTAMEAAGYQMAMEAYDAGDPERARQILKMYKLDETQVDSWAESYATKQAKQQNTVTGLTQAFEFMKAGAPDAANEVLNQYGIDTSILNSWQGLTDVQKEQLDYILSAMNAESQTGNDTGVKSLLKMVGLPTDSIDYSGTLNQRDIQYQTGLQSALNNVNLQYQTAKSRYSGSGSSGSSGRKNRSSSTSQNQGVQYTSSNITSLINKLAGMDESNPMYSVIQGQLQQAGVDVSGLQTGTTGSSGVATRRQQIAANAAQGQQAHGSDKQTIYNSLRLQGYSEDEIAYAMGTLK